jgi:hypothetical protein
MLQCRLIMQDLGGSWVQTAWIPRKFAVKGKLLDLKNEEGEWSKGWEVIEVFKLDLDYDYVREHERDYKKQREASDI